MLTSTDEFEYVKEKDIENQIEDFFDISHYKKTKEENYLFSSNKKNKIKDCLYKCKHLHRNIKIAQKYHFFTKCFICDFNN